MAEEAAVENLPFNRFFCHKCSREIHGVLNDYKCPNCQCGFIEVLENHPDQNDESDQDADSDMPAPFEDMLSEMLSDAGYRFEERRGGRARRSSRARARNQLPIENLLQDFIVNLTSWGGSNTIGVGTARTGTPGGHLLLMANPGDYAWGREGLDAIVTQLLNQMDTTGPPPLAKEKISQIPVVIITKEQQDTNLQCSVCWEDFKVDEPVRKLPCEHVYHENCIIPWLELHGTCPICRKTLTDDGRVEDPDNSSNVVGNSLATLLRYARTSETSNSRTSSSSSSSSGTGSTGSTSSSNTNSSRPDFNMDIDFD